ncbi:MAG: hypothetical protein ACRD1N_00575 [Terriglobia bacterium]
MSYTTVPNVAGMFPTFVRGTAQQKPADTLIQQYVDDVAGEIDAVLNRRFGETIRAAYGGNFAAFQSALSLDALNVLEKINRYGAAQQLGESLAAFGVAAAQSLAQGFAAEFERVMGELNATGERGEPLPGGVYDHLFDAAAATPSPRPGFQGISGGDQPRNQTPEDVGMSNFFGKFNER